MATKKAAFRFVRWTLTRGAGEAEIARKTGTPRLQTIPFSHYCEMARWCLEHHGIPFEENPALPGLSFNVADLRGEKYLSESGSFAGSASSGRRSERNARKNAVPCMVLPCGRVLRSSWDILNYAYVEIGGCDESEMMSQEVREHLDNELAPAVRVVAYYHLLSSSKNFINLVQSIGSPYERFLYSFIGKSIVVPNLKSWLDISESNCAAAVQIVRDSFQRRSEYLQMRLEVAPEGVAPQKMSRSASFMSVYPEDMAFAALSAALLLPPQYGGPSWQGKGGRSSLLPSIGKMPDAFRDLCMELRETPAGANAMRVYSKRHAFKASGE